MAAAAFLRRGPYDLLERIRRPQTALPRPRETAMALLLTTRDDVIGCCCRGVDLAGIIPERLAGLSAGDVAQLPIRADKREQPLGEFFAVQGRCEDGRVVLQGELGRVHRVAAGMTAGDMLVDGDTGRHAGEAMTGGRLTVKGSAGDWLACGLRGGVVHVAGDAGDNAACSLPQASHGVDGGTVLIEGSAGRLVGSRMRRGIVAVGGDCGEAAGFELRAGTVVVGGQLGPRAGAAMQRGSIVTFGPPPVLWPGFARGSVWQPTFLPILLAWLAHQGWKTPVDRENGPWQHWHGDLTTGCRGELFCQPA
jgi:formylmethanofuran dehydrogenase subunit C